MLSKFHAMSFWILFFELHSLVEPLIVSCNGVTELFYPKLYDVIVDNPNILKGIAHNCSMLLVMKVVKVVIAYVAGATLNDDLLELKYN